MNIDFRRVLNDPLLFAESLLIEPMTESPFKANYVQRLILGAVKDHQRIAVRVSRQTGKTYALTVICLWAAITKSRRKILVITPDKSKADVIFKNMDMFLQVNPALASSLLRSYSGNPQMGREFTNGSMILGFTTGASSHRKGNSVRGQGGDVIIIDEAAYLTEEDWISIEPIIQGGLYRQDALTIVSSTPNPDSHGGMFYDIFTKPELRQIWHTIHVPITENPDFAGVVERYRQACPNELAWTTEYLAEFPDQASRSLVRRSQVDSAGRDYRYNLYQVSNGPRAIGVDWDKYEAGVNIVIVRYDPHGEYYHVMYREELPPSDTLLTEGVRRVLELQELTGADWVAVDRGYGEMQLEVLRTEAAMRSMNLPERIVGYSFQELVDFTLDKDIYQRRVRLKDAAYQWMSFLLDKGLLFFPATDEQLKRQLLGIQVRSTDAYGMTFKTAKDHIVSALALALWQLRTEAPYWQRTSNVPSNPVVLELGNKRDGGLPSIQVVDSGRGMGFRGRSFTLSSLSRSWR